MIFGGSGFVFSFAFTSEMHIVLSSLRFSQEAPYGRGHSGCCREPQSLDHRRLIRRTRSLIANHLDGVHSSNAHSNQEFTRWCFSGSGLSVILGQATGAIDQFVRIRLIEAIP
jgi:hypothetical protein